MITDHDCVNSKAVAVNVMIQKVVKSSVQELQASMARFFIFQFRRLILVWREPASNASANASVIQN
jgi:hypothetical protein